MSLQTRLRGRLLRAVSRQANGPEGGAGGLVGGGWASLQGDVREGGPPGGGTQATDPAVVHAPPQVRARLLWEPAGAGQLLPAVRLQRQW